MKNKLAKVQPIDPEFAAFYPEVLPRQSDKPPAPSNRESSESGVQQTEDELQIAARMLRENQANQTVKRSELQGFDLVEHDVSNITKLAWNFLTRD